MNMRISEIDLLRFTAAMMVVFFHYTFRGFAADGLSDVGFPELAPISQYGFLGVELFFMISGFVILMTASSGSLRKFAISRIVRLYPAFWFGCTLTFVAILTLGTDRFKASTGQYLINLTMLNEFINVPSIDGVYWTLAVEIKFYLFIAGILIIRQIDKVQRYLVLWLGLTIILEFLPSYMLSQILNTRFAPFFIVGALSYLVYSQGWTKLRAALYVISSVLALHAAFNSSKRYAQYYQTDFDPFIVGALVTSFIFVMILISMRKLGAIAKYDWRVLGALTYPVYLIHQNIGFMILNALNQRVERFLLLAITIFAILSMAYLIQMYIERPLAARMKSLLSRRLFSSDIKSDDGKINYTAEIR